jgi:hypothetical protein
MVTKEELKHILIEEEIEERYNSIDKKRLNKRVKDREWYLNYTKKEYHPISYQVKREVEEWERSAPLFKEFEEIGDTMHRWVTLYISFWFILGLMWAGAILL